MADLGTGAVSKEEAVRIIDTFTDAPSLELIPLVNALLRHADRDVRGQALTLLEGLSDAALLPIVQQGLQDADPAVRLQAIETTAHLQSPALPALLTASYNDSDPNVRLVAFQTATEQPPEQRQPLITAAVKNPNQDLAQSAIDLLEAEPSKFSIATIMEGLDHKEPFIREKAHDILALTLGEPFKSSAEAKAWWGANERKYDKDLVRVVD
jgi:HEAT repeat protein